jgi:hypothetical protein
VITNSYLEASGENLMFGGADPSVPNLVPADIVISHNLVSKRLAWRTRPWTVKKPHRAQERAARHHFRQHLREQLGRRAAGFRDRVHGAQ